MNWRNFLDDIFGDDTKPGKVMIQGNRMNAIVMNC